MSCESSSFPSQPSHNTEAHLWRQDFIFQVKHGNEKLRIELFDANFPSGMRNPELFSEISLENLSDQTKHDETIQMKNNEGRLTQCRLHLSLQWIHSKVKYLTNVMQKWDHHIWEERKNHESYIADIDTLYSPFDGMRHLSFKNQNAGVNYRMENEPITNENEKQFAALPAQITSTVIKVVFYAMCFYFIVS